jgi:glycosyltransferase involved in cell wall biosynthesis
MKIAHVTDCYLPRMGGIERQVEGLAAAQSAFGHDVTVITSVPAPAATPHRIDPFAVIRPRQARSKTGKIRYSSMLAGRRAVLEGDFDLVHIHASTFSPLAYLAAGAATKAGIPTVATLHSLWSYATPIFRVADTALGWRRWPITWTAVSRIAAASLEPVLPAGTHVSVLPNGVSPELWHVQRQPGDENRVVLASVMRLAARKRPLQFLKMLREVRDHLPGHVALEVRIAGDGPKRRAMEAYLRRHDMTSWVQLAGQLPQRGIKETFADADLYASPSTLESFGIAALEARSAGLPVVAFARSGVSDFITDGQNGLLVNSDAEMSAALTRLAAFPALRAAMTEHNSERDAGYDWRTVLQRCEAVYAIAMDAASTGPLTNETADQTATG